MTLWVVEPKDPLIFRDGRSFDPVPGARAVSLPFPFPSTIAGAVRTREGQDDRGKFQKNMIPHVQTIGIRGPLLVELDEKTKEIESFLVSAPRDALLFGPEFAGGTKGRLKALVPLEIDSDSFTDLPGDMHLVGMAVPDLAKPYKDAPAFWYWETYEKWLMGPEETFVVVEELGLKGPTSESRFHASIDPETGTVHEEKGAFFQTIGLDFVTRTEKTGFKNLKKLGLAVETQAKNLKNGLGFMGGERRVVGWHQSEKSLPSCPLSLTEQIVKDRHCRLILLTPAYFVKGWLPTRFLAETDGVHPILYGVAVGRPQVVAGWDMALGKPKPARRLAAAGTVFFLELSGTDDAIAKWVEKTWMSSVSDEKQDCLDGFGLAVLGVWDGKPRRMEV